MDVPADSTAKNGSTLLKDLVQVLNTALEAAENRDKFEAFQETDFYDAVRQFEISLIRRALIRTGGNLVTASTLINNTRVTRGGLAAATPADLTAGLLTKLQYEQDIELMGLGDAVFFNRRRIDGLEPKTPHQMPVPAKELQVLRKALYTYGGIYPAQ